MWFWVRKVISIFKILIRIDCPHFANEKYVSEKLGREPRVTECPKLLSGGTGARWYLQPAETRLGVSRKPIPKGSGL